MLPEVKHLRKLIYEKGVDRVRLARRLGVTVPTISKWINGRREPTGVPLATLKEVIKDLLPTPIPAPELDRMSLFRRLVENFGPVPAKGTGPFFIYQERVFRQSKAKLGDDCEQILVSHERYYDQDVIVLTENSCRKCGSTFTEADRRRAIESKDPKVWAEVFKGTCAYTEPRGRCQGRRHMLLASTVAAQPTGLVAIAETLPQFTGDEARDRQLLTEFLGNVEQKTGERAEAAAAAGISIGGEEPEQLSFDLGLPDDPT